MTAAGPGVRAGTPRAGHIPPILPGRLGQVVHLPDGPVSRSRWAAAWYGLFAVYAGITAVVSAASYERTWGDRAVGAYAVASLVALTWRSHGRDAAIGVSFVGALIGPLVWLSAKAPPTPDVQVVARSAMLLLRHGNPYISPAELAHLPGHLGYNPYLPAMVLFGIPRALGLSGWVSDPRVWLAVATLVLFILAFRIAGRRDAVRCSVLGMGTPIVAFPLALGITDPPILALVCFALALLSRSTRPLSTWLPAAIAIGLGCAMKFTAWPALPVLVALVATRDGARAAVKFTAAAVGTMAALVAACAPAALSKPGTLFQNTVLFPLALTHAQTPAASPLPGHLLANTGHAGHLVAVGLLVAAGLAVTVSLVIRPPADGSAAALRLAIGLAVLFALSPAARFGYFAYPAGLLGWIVLSRVPPAADAQDVDQDRLPTDRTEGLASPG